ncbi:MAG TPA: NAD-dependent epimerase/dehydratase family protein [Chthoniobacteraceae bacterium]|jgi:nucleoside-diphosphate-sugar epimerase|nr:NAD-dependent epimerase/dehydratase family protein [Chthoniobacteraceae bacterium]
MPTPLPSTVAITGAHGWLGSCLVRHFRAAGWQTGGLVRRPREESDVSFSLGEEVPAGALEGARALVHAAYDFSPRTWAELERVNVRGSEKLFRAATAAGVEKIVFISTMSAFPAARSLYGRAKLAIEQLAADHGAFIVRPGLITGDADEGGMMGHLRQQVHSARVLPLIAGNAELYLNHEADLSELIVRYCNGAFPAPREPIVTAHPEPWTFRRILETLAARAGRRPVFVPIPWRGVWLGLRLAEALGLRLNFRSDSVLSLANQDRAPDFGTHRALAYEPRKFVA